MLFMLIMLGSLNLWVTMEITFTKEIDKAFQMRLRYARDIVKTIEISGKECCVLKIID